MVLTKCLLLTTTIAFAAAERICNDDCFGGIFSGDGICDDVPEYVGSDWIWCELGTDCMDCGARYRRDDYIAPPDAWDVIDVDYGSDYGSAYGSDTTEGLPEQPKIGTVDAPPTDAPPTEIKYACYDADGDAGYHPYNNCSAAGMQIVSNLNIECGSTPCEPEDCCEEIPEAGSLASPSPSPSPTPTIFAESPVEDDVVMEGAVGILLPCENLVDTGFLKRSIAQNIRDGLTDGGLEATEETIPDDSVQILEAKCGSTDVTMSGRKLTGAQMLTAKYEIIITAEKATAAGITSKEDVELISEAIAKVKDSGVAQEKFLEALSAQLEAETPPIIIAPADMTVKVSGATDTTKYEAMELSSSGPQSSTDEEEGLAGWGMAIIAVALICAVALVVGAFFYFKRAHRTDEDMETHMIHVDMTTDDNDEERNFVATSAPHAL